MARSIRTREDLNHYLDAFNKNETEVYSAYYASDAEMALGALVLNNKAEILQFFQTGRALIAEHVAPELVLFDRDAIAITATITFTAKVDIEEPFFDIGPPVPKGGGYLTAFTIFYGLNKNGEIHKVYAGKVKPTKVFKPGKL